MHYDDSSHKQFILYPEFRDKLLYQNDGEFSNQNISSLIRMRLREDYNIEKPYKYYNVKNEFEKKEIREKDQRINRWFE